MGRDVRKPFEKDVVLDEARNEKERFMEPYIYDLSRNTDMKQTCFVTQTKLNNEITSKKTRVKPSNFGQKSNQAKFFFSQCLISFSICQCAYV